MNREEAKRILEVYRPGRADAAKPELNSALAQARRDPELGEWLEQQIAFDDAVSQTLRGQRVPKDLKGSILAEAFEGARHPWCRRPGTWGMAASLVAVLVWIRLSIGTAQPRFADLRQDLVDQSWGEQGHVDFTSSDPAKVRLYLKHGGLNGDFNIPSALADVPVMGCRILESHGHKVGFICLADGPRHTHLFVVDRVQGPDAPTEQSPQFEGCEGWRTISWSAGSKTYMVVGMNYNSFVRKFRKGGHWLWMGTG